MVDVIALIKEVGREEGREEGHKKGIEQGIEQGIKRGRQEGRQAGREEGAREKSIATAKRMIELNLDAEIIATATELSLEDVQKIAREMKP